MPHDYAFVTAQKFDPTLAAYAQQRQNNDIMHDIKTLSGKKIKKSLRYQI